MIKNIIRYIGGANALFFALAALIGFTFWSFVSFALFLVAAFFLFPQTSKKVKMNKWVKLGIILTAFSFGTLLLIGTMPKRTEEPIKKETADNFTLLKRSTSSLKGSGSIKEVALKGDKAAIYYVKNYEEYKRINPQSSVSESLLDSYWDTGDAVKKSLIDGSVRLMRKNDFLNEVSINIPRKGKEYSITVNKKDLEQFLGTDFESVKKNWNELFSNPYVYTKEGREKFFNRFGKIK